MVTIISNQSPMHSNILSSVQPTASVSLLDNVMPPMDVYSLFQASHLETLTGCLASGI
jgi:hypothetical protein